MLSATWQGPPIVYDRDLTEPPLSLIVGRQDELQDLEDLLRQAMSGTGRVVFITGEPGIGKTSLSDEFLRRTRTRYPGVLVSRGRCVEQYGTGEAYLPFLDAMSALLEGPGRERLAALMRTYAPTWCTQLPAAFSSTGTIEKLQQETIGATKERMMREMGDALGMFATTSPVSLILEDLHWADPSSVDLLRHLCQRISNQRILIAGTFRPEDIERSNHPLKGYKAEMQTHNLCEEIALDSLKPEHIGEYMNATFSPNDFPAEFALHIHEKTEGHPLFATNLLQYLNERGDIAKTNDHWTLSRPLAEMELELPQSVRSMISKKIDALEPQEKLALQYASVEGDEFLSTVAAVLLGVSEVEFEELMAHLEKTHRLITTRGEEELPDGSLATRYRFAHALYQNYLYGDLVNKRRVMLHQQAGERLVQHYGNRATQIATQLALHFERGRDFSRAVEYLLKSAENATALFANAEAADHCTKAIELAEKIPGGPPAETMAALYQRRGTANMALSRFAQAVDDYLSALKHLKPLDSAEKEAPALIALTLTLFFSHRLEEMAQRAEQALDAAKRAGSESMRLETMCLMGLKHLCYGELDVGEPILNEVVKSGRLINHKPALLAGLTWRGCLYFFQTEYERAIEYEIEARQLALELRDGFLLLTSMFFIGLSCGNLGRMSEALATLEEAIRMAHRNGDLFWGPRMPNCIGWLHRELQDFESAFKYDQQGLEVGRNHHVLEAQANSLINLGIDYTHAGKSDETIDAFNQTRDIFERDAWFRWRYNIRLEAATAEHWLRLGDLQRAAEFAQRLLDTATQYKVHKYIAEAHRLMARIAIANGDPGKAESEFALVFDELNRYHAPLVAWKAHAEFGQLKKDLGDPEASREAYAEALKIINECAANVSNDELRETFLNSQVVRNVIAGSSKTVGTNQ